MTRVARGGARKVTTVALWGQHSGPAGFRSNTRSIHLAFDRLIVPAPLLFLLIDGMNECEPALWQRLSRLV